MQSEIIAYDDIFNKHFINFMCFINPIPTHSRYSATGHSKWALFVPKIVRADSPPPYNPNDQLGLNENLFINPILEKESLIRTI